MAEQVTEVASFELPYRRKAQLRRVEFDSGMMMVRLVLREGTRITQIDLDGDAAVALGEAIADLGRKV